MYSVICQFVLMVVTLQVLNVKFRFYKPFKYKHNIYFTCLASFNDIIFKISER